jgi:hypothetical protein
MAASTPVHASSASAWGSAAILGGLPKISGRGGDEALEGSGSVEVILLSPLGSGAAFSGKGAAIMLVGAAGVAEGASGVLVVLAVARAAGAAPWTLVFPCARGLGHAGSCGSSHDGWCVCGRTILFFSGGVRRHRRCDSGHRVRTRRGLAGLTLLPPLLLFLLFLGVPGKERRGRKLGER